MINRKRLLKGLLLVAGALALLLMLLLGIIIVPDQIRPAPVPPSRPSLALSTGHNSSSPIVDVDRVTSQAINVDNATSQTLWSLLSEADLTIAITTETCRVVAQRLVASVNLTVPDQYKMSKARQVDLTEFVIECLTLSSANNHLASNESYKQLIKLGDDMIKLNQRHQNNQWLLDEMKLVKDAYWGTALKVALDHQDWILAGKSCFSLGKDDESRYYLRNAGIRGRFVQSITSIMDFANKRIEPIRQKWQSRFNLYNPTS